MSKPINSPLAGEPIAAPDAHGHGPRLEGATQAFVDGLKGSEPIYTLSPVAARAVLSNARRWSPLPRPKRQAKTASSALVRPAPRGYGSCALNNRRLSCPP